MPGPDRHEGGEVTPFPAELGLDETMAGGAAGAAGETAPTPIGPYRLLRRLGAGGMGEVWEAEQQAPVRRRVALKLIKPGMATRELLARFDLERHALALMQHPGVAQIFDAGTAPDGRPFIAMELVDGVPLTRFCDDQRLDVTARLALFQKVCDAVQHAHQKGVIHRDLKPSNVLVSAGAPKVIDFGLAKVSEGVGGPADSTQTGVWLGTPAYASPEQMQLTGAGVDTRSDVYSLAMMLYELLAGALPFDLARAMTVLELRRMLWEEELPRPSARLAALEDQERVAASRGSDPAALRRRLRGDLDWIVIKGLERDLTRRYGTVDELSADLGRHLRNEPVTAGPPSKAYRARKFVLRHRLGVLAAAGLFVLLVGFAVTMGVQARRIAGERDRAEREAAKAAAVTTFLQETIGAADPWQNGRDVSVREALGGAAARVATSFRDQPLVGAAVRRAIGNTYTELGRYDDARTLLEAALATRVAGLGPAHPDVAESHADLATMFERSGKLDDALAHDRAALAIRRGMSDRGPLAESLMHLALTLFSRGEFADAARAGEESLRLREQLFGPRSRQVADTLNMLAAVAGSGLGDDERSAALAERAVGIRRELKAVDDPATADVINQLAIARQALGKLPEAEALFREALRIHRAALGADHPTTAVAMENLGGVLLRQKRYDETMALLAEVLAVRKAKLGEDSPAVTRTMLNLATTQWMAGHLAEAEAGYLAAIPRLKKDLGEDHPNVATTLMNLSSLLVKQHRDADAEARVREALAIRTRKLAATHPEIAATKLALARILARRGQREEAEKLMVEAVAAYETTRGKEASETLEAEKALAALRATP